MAMLSKSGEVKQWPYDPERPLQYDWDAICLTREELEAIIYRSRRFTSCLLTLEEYITYGLSSLKERRS